MLSWLEPCGLLTRFSLILILLTLKLSVAASVVFSVFIITNGDDTSNCNLDDSLKTLKQKGSITGFDACEPRLTWTLREYV